MMCDLPHPLNTIVLDFADDIAFMVTETTLEKARENKQCYQNLGDLGKELGPPNKPREI